MNPESRTRTGVPRPPRHLVVERVRVERWWNGPTTNREGDRYYPRTRGRDKYRRCTPQREETTAWGCGGGRGKGGRHLPRGETYGVSRETREYHRRIGNGESVAIDRKGEREREIAGGNKIVEPSADRSA